MVCDDDVNSDGQGVLDGARAPFFGNAYDGVGIKKKLEGAVLPVRPFVEEEEEYRKEFAGTE